MAGVSRSGIENDPGVPLVSDKVDVLRSVELMLTVAFPNGPSGPLTIPLMNPSPDRSCMVMPVLASPASRLIAICDVVEPTFLILTVYCPGAGTFTNSNLPVSSVSTLPNTAS